MTYDKTELDRILTLQRQSFLREGAVSAAVRRARVSRLALTLLENIDAIAQTLSIDYGYRPPALTKALETRAWADDVQDILDNLEQWMAPMEVPGGFIQSKPKGVVGIIGAWNFPIILTFEPALEALAAGNRVMINFSEFHVRTAALLAELFAKALPQEEVALIHGDLATAQHFSELRFDHLFFTGSPKVGSLVSQAAARNLVPVTLELGGKNPAVVDRDADLDMAARRIASTRALNGGQICMCPDYVLVPQPLLEPFVEKLRAQFADLFPTYLENPSVVSIVNDRNFDRVVGLIDDAVAQGARKISVAPSDEADRLPDRASRRIAPTILLEVPESARIAHEEIFGPVLAVYGYDSLDQAIDYIKVRPSPLAAYWYGPDNARFRRFLDQTTSGGVSRNDGLLQAMLPGAPFGGIGNSGSGAYHGKAGFDTFTHRRTVAHASGPKGMAEDLLDGTLLGQQSQAEVDAGIATLIRQFQRHLAA